MEQKHESDMTSKEKRQAEFRKIRSLKGKARLQYFWMYYKILYFLPFILAGAVWFSLFIYGNMQEKVLLSVAVCDTKGDAEQNTRKMQEDLLAVLGSGDRHETVKLDSSVSSGDDSSSVTKRTVVLGRGIRMYLSVPVNCIRAIKNREPLKTGGSILERNTKDMHLILWTGIWIFPQVWCGRNMR